MDITSSHIADVLQAFGRWAEDADGYLETFAADFPDWEVVARLLAEVIGQSNIIAISGSQGSGKSTLARVLQEQLGDECGVVSLDDFYLTKAERNQLANDVHPLLATRGVPGTHDYAWISSVLDAVSRNASVEVPSFDKGLDDRSGTRQIGCRPLIFEGWAIGAVVQTTDELTEPTNMLEAKEDLDGAWRAWVNETIARHYVDLWRKVDFWVHLRVPSFEQVYAWRRQQERDLPPSQQMAEVELNRFVQHYERVTKAIWQASPMGPGLVVQIARNHRVIGLSAIA